jgi:hypothetical protein
MVAAVTWGHHPRNCPRLVNAVTAQVGVASPCPETDLVTSSIRSHGISSLTSQAICRSRGGAGARNGVPGCLAVYRPNEILKILRKKPESCCTVARMGRHRTPTSCFAGLRSRKVPRKACRCPIRNRTGIRLSELAESETTPGKQSPRHIGQRLYHSSR